MQGRQVPLTEGEARSAGGVHEATPIHHHQQHHMHQRSAAISQVCA